MNEQYEHYITKNIRSFYRRKLIFPGIVLIILVLLFFIYPIRSMLFPVVADDDTSLAECYTSRNPYVYITLHDLYFTGYRTNWLGRTDGYYYYTMMNDECVIVFLSPSSSQDGESTIDEISVYAQIFKNSSSEERLIQNLSSDLGWTVEGLSSHISEYMISEPDARDLATRLLIVFVIGSFLYGVFGLIIYFIFSCFPTISPPVNRLIAYGQPKRILARAEDELATLPQLATEDMFITEHYFIETSPYGTAIVPIREIVWIYKYSTLHKLLWHHFSISYTLYITAKNRRYIRCPKNIKSDIDGIIDYLSEANHNILVGFSEENRQKVEEMQGEGELLRKLWAFLSKRI